jgi:hypothetical protein
MRPEPNDGSGTHPVPWAVPFQFTERGRPGPVQAIALYLDLQLRSPSDRRVSSLWTCRPSKGERASTPGSLLAEEDGELIVEAPELVPEDARSSRDAPGTARSVAPAETRHQRRSTTQPPPASPPAEPSRRPSSVLSNTSSIELLYAPLPPSAMLQRQDPTEVVAHWPTPAPCPSCVTSATGPGARTRWGQAKLGGLNQSAQESRELR